MFSIHKLSLVMDTNAMDANGAIDPSDDNDSDHEESGVKAKKAPKEGKIDRRKIVSKENIKKALAARMEKVKQQKLLKAADLVAEAGERNEESSSDSEEGGEFELDLKPITKVKKSPAKRKLKEPEDHKTERLQTMSIIQQLADAQAKKMLRDKKRRAKARDEKRKEALLKIVQQQGPVAPVGGTQQASVPNHLQDKVNAFLNAMR